MWNQAMLTSHADIYVTARNLIANVLGSEMIEKSIPGQGKDLLMQKLPKGRTCAEASVPESLCLPAASWAAGTLKRCNVSTVAMQSAQQAVLDHLNRVTRKYQDECSVLSTEDFNMEFRCIQQVSTDVIHLETHLRFNGVVFFARVRQTGGISIVLYALRQTAYATEHCLESLMKKQPLPGELILEYCVCKAQQSPTPLVSLHVCVYSCL